MRCLYYLKEKVTHTCDKGQLIGSQVNTMVLLKLVFKIADLYANNMLFM